jgi:dimethylhistidine N-methyltransferase
MTYEAVTSVQLHDLHPPRQDFLRDVCRGLARRPKRLPSMYFYDAEGSLLFDRICELEEYYPTRTEMGLLDGAAGALAERLGERCMLLELGSGSSAKTTILLRALPDVHSYVPIDIAREPLRRVASRFRASFPELVVSPVCADFMAPLRLPAPRTEPRRRVVFFPGSTIGNFDPVERQHLFESVARLCGRGGAFLIGFDLQKDRARLERAYNDDRGVTAAFNLNLLSRINRELGADFDVTQFRHRASYDDRHHRIEMHLESRLAQRVRVDGRAFEFERGETVCTEHSYKFTVEGFLEEAGVAGFAEEQVFVDDERLFAVALLKHAPRD